MAFTRVDVRAEAKQLAQQGSAQLLVTDPGDYNECIDQALRMFSQDRPNDRIVHQTLAASGFRQQLFGAGAMSGLTGLDAWIDGFSAMAKVWYPYIESNQDSGPLDINSWRLQRDPGPKVFLIFTGDTPAAGQILRLEFVSPHVLHESDPVQSSTRTGDKDPFVLLTAHFICLLTSVRYAQNTGNTGLPNDTVDRRTQSDVMKSRAKDLLEKYNIAVGKGTAADIKGASAFGDLDVESSHGAGFLWHSTLNR